MHTYLCIHHCQNIHVPLIHPLNGKNNWNGNGIPLSTGCTIQERNEEIMWPKKQKKSIWKFQKIVPTNSDFISLPGAQFHFKGTKFLQFIVFFSINACRPSQAMPSLPLHRPLFLFVMPIPKVWLQPTYRRSLTQQGANWHCGCVQLHGPVEPFLCINIWLSFSSLAKLLLLHVPVSYFQKQNF